MFGFSSQYVCMSASKWVIGGQKPQKARVESYLSWRSQKLSQRWAFRIIKLLQPHNIFLAQLCMMASDTFNHFFCPTQAPHLIKTPFMPVSWQIVQLLLIFVIANLKQPLSYFIISDLFFTVCSSFMALILHTWWKACTVKSDPWRRKVKAPDQWVAWEVPDKV